MNMAGGPGIFSESARFSLGEIAANGVQSRHVRFSGRGVYVCIGFVIASIVARLWRFDISSNIIYHHTNHHHLSSSGILHGPFKIGNSVVVDFFFFFLTNTDQLGHRPMYDT